MHLEMALADSGIDAVHLKTALADGHLLTRHITRCIFYLNIVLVPGCIHTLQRLELKLKSDNSGTFSF
jgi:hypothetical protein